MAIYPIWFGQLVLAAVVALCAFFSGGASAAARPGWTEMQSGIHIVGGQNLAVCQPTPAFLLPDSANCGFVDPADVPAYPAPGDIYSCEQLVPVASWSCFVPDNDASWDDLSQLAAPAPPASAPVSSAAMSVADARDASLLVFGCWAAVFAVCWLARAASPA